ncbi:MAG: acyloxyacyl hydrolase, partial [Acidobacteriota bacterium]|nr:acyloxyacyl hydrolase [Acidobacteriota bacterium]
GINAQQQDLVFTYLLSGGLRYDISRRWSVSLSAMDQHLSNGYLAQHNYGVDSLGVSLGLFAHF